MNKQLLSTLCAAAFSGIIFAAEAPDYTFLQQDLHEYCTANNTPACLNAAAMMKTVTLAIQARGNDSVEPTQEEKEQLKPLQVALHAEFNEFNARKTHLLLHTAQENNNNETLAKLLESGKEEKQEDAQDLSEKLNPTDSADSKE